MSLWVADDSRLGNRPIKGPATSDAADDARIRNICGATGLLETHGFPVESHLDVCTLVVALLGFRSPFAVLRPVALVVVFSFDRHAWRSRPHVREEVREPVPAFAYRNPASPIVGVAGACGPVASFQHGAPNSVFSGTAKAVRARAISCCFVAQASARTCVPVSQIASDRFNRGAAIASAIPPSLCSVSARKGDDHEPPKPLPQKIDKRAHIKPPAAPTGLRPSVSAPRLT